MFGSRPHIACFLVEWLRRRRKEEAAGLDGEALSARDCSAVGENFVDPHCPLCLLPCGSDAEGLPVLVHCLVVGEVQGKLLVCLPAASWHRKVAKRTILRGFLSKVFGAEVVVAALSDRATEAAGQTARVWLGLCEGSTESTIQVSDEDTTVPFGALPAGELVVPLVDALVDLWEQQLGGGVSTPMRTGTEGTDPQPGLPERLASIEKALVSLGANLGGPAPAVRPVPARPKVRVLLLLAIAARGATAAYPGLDQSVVAAALSAGVQPQALAEMQDGHPGALNASEGRARHGAAAAPLANPARRVRRGSRCARGSQAQGFGAGCAARSSAHRPRGGFCSSDGPVPGLTAQQAFKQQGQSVLTSTRAWLEHRSRMQSFPTTVHLTWRSQGHSTVCEAAKPSRLERGST